MFGLQSTLEIARRALRAHQVTIGVIGNNIANVETPGFSRRRVELSAGMEVMTGVGSIGAGVDVLGVNRTRDRALDGLYRDHGNTAGRWGAMQETLARVETAFPANDDGGLGKSLTEFYGSWNDLANQPESQAARIAVREKGRALTETFHRLDKHLDALVTDVNDAIDGQTKRVNDIAGQIAKINGLMVTASTSNQEAAGLLDQRDMLLDELSQITDVQVDTDAQGAVSVKLGAEILVQGSIARQVEFAAESGGGERVLRWADTHREPAVSGGALAGYLEARDTRIESYRSTLDAVAAALVAETNRLHEGGTGLNGSTGTAFFSTGGVTAGEIRLDAAIEQDVTRIVASAGGGRGDGRQALAIAQLANAKLLNGGTETLGSAYRNLVGQIGFEANQATSFHAAQQSILAEVDAQRAEVSGVSMDEEMTNMLSAQHAYQAMVKVTSTVDDLLDTLINRM